MTMISAHTTNGQDTTAAAVPLWLPPGVTFASLPTPVQQVVVAVLNPAYQEHVLEATDALERGQGLSYCNVLFFEIMTTYSVAERAGLDWSRLPLSKGLAALLGVTGQKNKIANFLLALRKFRDKVERADAAPPQAQPKPSELEKHASC
jgi:hypothetical protein